MHKLVEDARADDSLFFHCMLFCLRTLIFLSTCKCANFDAVAGHGYQIKDQDQDENDGLDETIRPMDWPQEKYITDDVSAIHFAEIWIHFHVSFPVGNARYHGETFTSGVQAYCYF